jgi:hypothetical protein
MSTTAVSLGLEGAMAATDSRTASTTTGHASAVRSRTWRRLAAGAIAGLALGGVALVAGGSYTHGMIGDQLASQEIRFPPAGSPALDPVEYPGLQQYGGQLVDDGPKAKAWADEFMAPHIAEIGGGQSYGEVSLAARLNLDDQELQQQSGTMALGEVQRGLLLSAWGWWVVGTVTTAVGIGLLAVAATALVALLVVGWRDRRAPAFA